MTDALLIAILATINVIALSYAMYQRGARNKWKEDTLYEANSAQWAAERKTDEVQYKLNALEDAVAKGSLTFAKFAHMNAKRSAVAFPDCECWDSGDWMLALIGEIGEAANMLKKRLRNDNDPPTLQEVGYELADAVTYVDLLATYLELNLGELVAEKYNIISDRVGHSEFKL